MEKNKKKKINEESGKWRENMKIDIREIVSSECLRRLSDCTNALEQLLWMHSQVREIGGKLMIKIVFN